MRGNGDHHGMRGWPRTQDVETGRPLRSRISQRLKVKEEFPEVGGAIGGFPFAKIHSRGERPTTKCGLHLLASLVVAALPDHQFEHPGGAKGRWWIPIGL